MKVVFFRWKVTKSRVINKSAYHFVYLNVKIASVIKLNPSGYGIIVTHIVPQWSTIFYHQQKINVS